MEEDCPKLISDILTSIRQHDDSSDLQRRLEQCKAETVMSWHDSDGLDLLHHAILARNVIAIGALFSRGLFKPPHEPTSFPYIHLACQTGQKSIVVMLLQERPFDDRPAEFEYGQQQSTSDFSFDPDDAQQKLRTPLDVAADSGHIECVKTILDFQHAREFSQTSLLGFRDRHSKFSVQESYIDMACKMNSPKALRLLLTEHPAKKDLERSVSYVLKNGKPECLDVLLRCSIDRKSVFGGMNFFHVLYTYGILFDPSRYECLTLMTSVLLRHGHKPLAFRPSRTYPLYSLLSHAYANEDYLKESAPYLISCILLLLHAGADPNFDELKVEEIACDSEYETAFGRDAFSSALHCLYNTVAENAIGVFQESSEAVSLVSEYVFKCTEVLLRHHADPNYVGRLNNTKYGNSLHALGLASRHLSRVKPTTRLLLRHGADPNLQVSATFPLNSFCDAFVTDTDSTETSSSSSSSLLTQFVVSDNVKASDANCLVANMTRGALKAAGARLREVGNVGMSKRSRRLLENVLSQVEANLNGVWSLKKICQFYVWTLCQRDFRSVQKLPLPKSVMSEICNLF